MDTQYEIWINKGPNSTEMEQHTKSADEQSTGGLYNILLDWPRWNEGIWIVEMRNSNDQSVFLRGGRESKINKLTK